MKAVAICFSCLAILSMIATVALALYAVSNGIWKYLPVHIALFAALGVIAALNISIVRMENS